MSMDHPPGSDARHAAEISQQLHRQALNNAGVLWLAVDASNANALPLPDALEEALSGSAVVPVPLSHKNLDAAWRPRWLRLDTGTSTGSLLLHDSIEQSLSELRIDSLRCGQGRRIAGWIQLDAVDPRLAAAHVAREMIRTGPESGQRLLRLHDPAVLWALWPLLEDGRRRRLLGPIGSWTLLDPVGRIAQLSSTSEESPRAWDRELWADVDAITPANAAFRALAMSASAADIDIDRARSVAMAALRRARQLGFRDSRDLAAFARHALSVCPIFDSHPLVARALEKRTAEDHYLELVDVLTEADWAEIARTDDPLDPGTTRPRNLHG
jgi:hypothetical protein